MPSTVIKQFSYDAATKKLLVVFVSGLVYEYENIPEEVYNSMKVSGAKGIFFNQNIRNKYEFRKVDKM